MKKPFYANFLLKVGSIILCYFAYSVNSQYLVAQDIQIRNPSIEGTPKSSFLPSPWYKCIESPDTQPGTAGISLSASNGKTYAGALSGKNWTEGVGQKLGVKLKAGKTYQLSFDLAYPPQYFYNICYGSCAIYGSNEAESKDELLWKVAEFYDTAWNRYTATFTPSQDYSYISFYPYLDRECTKSNFTAYLLDNLSPFIYEVPQLEISARGTCKGKNNGVATVQIKNGEAPYTYSWYPGNYTSANVNNLRSGKYEVVVTGANGTSTKGQIEIMEYEITAAATITSADCYKSNNARISLNATGGIQPYIYSIDGGNSFQSSSSFDNMAAGYYNVAVKDAYDCVVNINNLSITDPSALMVSAEYTRSVSCSDVQNGKLILVATGGTPPYTYSIPGYISQRDSVISRLDAGQYHYRITDSHNCSVDGDAVVSKEWRDCAVFVPNAFSPNRDGLNDVFRAKINDDINSFRMAVYGRWGQLIFESANPDMGWDGTQKGIDQPAGSYMYVITFTDSKNQARKEFGTVLLIK